MKATRRQWLIAGAATVGAGSWFWLRDASPSQQEIESMKAFTDHMKTYCVGRFLIDAPLQASASPGSFGMRIASVEARPGPHRTVAMALQALDFGFQGRIADLRAQPPSPRGQSRFLGFWQGGAAVRVLYYLTPGEEPRGQADGLVARDGGVFFFRTNANEEADAKKLLDFLVEVEPALTMLAPDQMPTTPGFCIDNGLIAVNPKRGENVNGWGWTLSGHPDVTFGISTRTNRDTVEDGLVDREASILQEAGTRLMQHVRTLRKRRFEIDGMPAQEWSIEITDSKPEYQLDLEIPGKPNDNARPFITLGMRVGGSAGDGYRKPSLTPGEALVLWDAVIQTLRLRPGAM